MYNVKDLALMKWMGANSLRTCHYPYSEQFLDLCDRMGILVIDGPRRWGCTPHSPPPG